MLARCVSCLIRISEIIVLQWLSEGCLGIQFFHWVGHLQQQGVTFAHASSLLGSSCWPEIVMAESCPEALSGNIFLHIQSIADMYYRLDTLVKPCWSVMYGRRTINFRINFHPFVSSDEADKAFTRSFVVICWFVDIQAVTDFWVIVHDLQSCLTFR